MRQLVVLGLLAGCGEDPSLRVEITHPDDAAEVIARTTITVYESPIVSCAKVEFGDLGASELLAFALQGMTGARPRGPHITSPVAGKFEPPTYVLREPLDYGSFLRAVQTLRANGFSVSQIAAGVGVLQRDVADALRIADTRGTR